MKKSKAYIFDIDGTLALKCDRSPYDYSKVNLDKPNAEVVRMAKILSEKYKIIILSGREDSCRKETEKWLEDNGIKYLYLFMRRSGDQRRDSIVKAELYISMINLEFNVLGIFDDRNQVVDMWRSLGLTCFQVANGDF